MERGTGLFLAALVGCLFFAFWPARWRAGQLGGTAGDEKNGSGSFSFSSSQHSVHGAPLFISSELTRWVQYDHLARKIKVTTREQDPVSLATADHEAEYAVSYRVQFVTSRTPDELYVFGTERNGDDVVEVWSLEAIDGAWTGVRPGSGTPIGVPVQGVTPVSLDIAGGQFVHPKGRTAPLAGREELYSGPAFGGVLYAAVDPEKRFLLVLSADASQVHRLDLDGNSSPTVEFDASMVPLLEEMGSIVPRHEAILGRVYVMTPSRRSEDAHGPSVQSNMRIVLYDGDNDGVFDGLDALSYEEYVAAEYTWIDVFDEAQ